MKGQNITFFRRENMAYTVKAWFCTLSP